MIRGLFQPLHLLLLLGCLIVVLLVLLIALRKRTSPRPSAATPSLDDRLARLGALQRQGLISEAEYQAKHKELLDEL
jgi:hypothetical protein